MGLDRTGDGTDANVETAEEQPDRRPPPPPDKPGADGYPSRADSRQGAAAANETSPQTTAEIPENKSVKPGAEESNESPGKEDETSGERYDIGRVQDDGLGRPEAEPGAAETQAAPHDNPVAAETDKQAAPLSPAERTEEKATTETPAVEASESPNAAEPSGVDIGDRPDREPKQHENVPVTAMDTQQPSRNSLDSPGGTAADAREPARPAGETAELAVQAAEGEGQPESADKPQPDPPDHAIPVADASTDDKQGADQASVGLPEKSKAGEAAVEGGVTLAESTEEPGQRSEGPNGEAVAGDEASTRGEADAERAAGPRPLGERIMVDDKPLREYLDPVGAAAWSNEIGDVVNERAGDRMVDAESDKDSRFERLRKKGFEKGDDALDIAGKGTNRAHDLLARQPPTGHSEARTGPTMTDAPHIGIDPGNAMAAAIVAGVLARDGVRWFHRKVTGSKGAR